MRSTGSRTLFGPNLRPTQQPQPLQNASRRRRVMFLCLGNVCRSQMAEGFARQLGQDVFDSVSAGLAPGMMVDPVTIKLMREKGIDIEGHFPKEIKLAAHRGVDLVINMSGYPAPEMPGVAVREWKVEDPHMKAEKLHRQVRDQIEALVMELVMELRMTR